MRMETERGRRLKGGMENGFFREPRAAVCRGPKSGQVDVFFCNGSEFAPTWESVGVRRQAPGLPAAAVPVAAAYNLARLR